MAGDARRLPIRGKLIHHARRLVARVGRQLSELNAWSEAWALLPVTG